MWRNQRFSYTRLFQSVKMESGWPVIVLHQTNPWFFGVFRRRINLQSKLINLPHCYPNKHFSFWLLSDIATGHTYNKFQLGIVNKPSGSVVKRAIWICATLQMWAIFSCPSPIYYPCGLWIICRLSCSKSTNRIRSVSSRQNNKNSDYDNVLRQNSFCNFDSALKFSSPHQLI